MSCMYSCTTHDISTHDMFITCHVIKSYYYKNTIMASKSSNSNIKMAHLNLNVHTYMTCNVPKYIITDETMV